jgi:7SK snRNA methylphosphate capping enzyme
MFGYLPAPSHHLTSYHEVPEIETVGVTRRGKRKVMPVEVRTFPENLRFKTADWVNEETDYDKRGYDVIVACV